MSSALQNIRKNLAPVKQWIETSELGSQFDITSPRVASSGNLRVRVARPFTFGSRRFVPGDVVTLKAIGKGQFTIAN